MFGVTTAIVLDKRIKTKDETYAVKLRITRFREQKYYPLGKHLSTDDWDKIQEKDPRDKEIKRLKLLFGDIEKKAIKIIDDMEGFSFQEFEKKYNQKPKSSSNVLDAINLKMERLNLEGRISSAESYKSAFRSFSEFIDTHNRKKLYYSDVTPDWLEEYEKWMKERHNSITTTGIYIRNLRTIFNQAIEEGTVQREFYPFGKRKYVIPAGKNIKKALTIEEISKIYNYIPVSEAELKARDLWLFSYLCNGVNVRDIAKLQYKNISKKHITFIRSKTERSTKSDQRHIVILRMPEIDDIINKWGIKPETPETYIFNIISKGDVPAYELAKIKQATKTINKYIKRIGKNLNLDHDLSTYTARHSFATVLKRSGAPIEFISESLGHKDLKTTEHYLDSFEDEMKESFQKRLLDFK